MDIIPKRYMEIMQQISDGALSSFMCLEAHI